MSTTLRILLLLGLAAAYPGAQAQGIDGLIQQLQSQAAQPFSAERGAAFWRTSHPAPDGGQARSCSLCHSDDLTRVGEHVSTHKRIEPLAPAVNPKRLSDEGKVKKWLLRNCKWVLGRECSAQEKGDVLSFIRQFKAP